ncbi:MAG: T9SS type A sorting domain-containing protein [Bacteroidetes bacterium]|nr:T9SS type A sorting domain-containing protein [Bacteroidota bacterium]
MRSNIISDQLIIDSKTGFSANELISVSDLSGRVVYTVNGVEGNTQMAISTNKLSAGAYLISVMKNGSRMTKKIIVQR